MTAPVFYDLTKTVAQGEKQESRNALKDPTKVSRYRRSRIEMACSDRPLAWLVYHLPDRVFTESPRQQDALPHLPLPEGFPSSSLEHLVYHRYHCHYCCYRSPQNPKWQSHQVHWNQFQVLVDNLQQYTVSDHLPNDSRKKNPTACQ